MQAIAACLNGLSYSCNPSPQCAVCLSSSAWRHSERWWEIWWWGWSRYRNMHWFKWASFRGLYEESVFQPYIVDLTYLCEWVPKEFIWVGGTNACPCPSTPNALWILHMIPNLPICIRRAQTRLCGWADWGICHNIEVSHSLCACSSSSCVIGMCIAQISTWLDKLWALTVIFCQYTLLSRPLVPRYRRQRSTSAPSGPILANTTLTVIRFFGTRYLYKGNFFTRAYLCD